MKLGITGHRPQKLGQGWSDHSFHSVVKHNMRNAISGLDPEVIYTGMALGVDQWAAEIALDLRIPYVAVVPFKSQDRKWSPNLRNHYAHLMNKAIEVIEVDRQPGFISTHVPPEVYHYTKMHNRNRFLVDQLNENDRLLAVYNALDARSGAYNCVKYAESLDNHPKVLRMHPDKFPEYKGKHPRRYGVAPPVLDDDDVPF